ncbi:LytR/AlgR family response regulator transcription factor [Steroidobacter cummioxidans]|uniref:LytR/AlgR family response regulator transcription factor n=1 Tax=Steroidobacter cummioxidans TaxID=1803913 RepID=UPI000E32007D|nr:LytTR family DNA-binding domain-containing protein [Steroidobacter cummioxidans]
MSARIILLPRDVAWPLRSDFKTSAIGWGAFIALLSCYCMVYQVVVDNVPADFAASFSHVFKNWGVWLVSTPVIFAALRKYSTKWHDRAVEFAALVALVVFISAAVPVAVDLLTNARNAASSLMIFLPRYVAVVGVVYLIWHVFLRERRVMTETVEVLPPPVIEPTACAEEPERPATLLVSKGADQCLIQIGRIECVSAAGNYVEIVERGQRYLLRATLKQVEDLLPASDFIRIHRSHLVRRDEIERIKSQPSGNGTVHLRGGQALPMSKKHKQALQRYRPME